MELLRAKNGFVARSLGLTIKGGQLVPAAHPVVVGREDLFEPAEHGVEQATRAPGEMRVLARRPDAVLMRGDKKPEPTRRGGRKKPAAASTSNPPIGDGTPPPAGGAGD